MAKGFGKTKKQEKKIPFVVNFEYEATGKTPDNTIVRSLGESKISKTIDADDYIDDGIVFAEALRFVMNDFYSFEFEKKGYTEVSEVTITIKNLRTE